MHRSALSWLQYVARDSSPTLSVIHSLPSCASRRGRQGSCVASGVARGHFPCVDPASPQGPGSEALVQVLRERPALLGRSSVGSVGTSGSVLVGRPRAVLCTVRRRASPAASLRGPCEPLWLSILNTTRWHGCNVIMLRVVDSHRLQLTSGTLTAVELEVTDATLSVATAA